MQAITAVSIEPSSTVQRLVRLTLEFNGISVAQADEGGAGLELIQSLNPDLVLIGADVAGIGALELCRLIRIDFQLCNTAVVVLADSLDDLHVQQGLKAGASAYLGKPFSPVRLTSLVHQLMGSPSHLTSLKTA